MSVKIATPVSKTTKFIHTNGMDVVVDDEAVGSSNCLVNYDENTIFVCSSMNWFVDRSNKLKIDNEFTVPQKGTSEYDIWIEEGKPFPDSPEFTVIFKGVNPFRRK